MADSFEARLTRLASLMDHPKSFYICKLFEDYYLAEKADQTFEKIYTLCEVVKELGLGR